MSFRTTWRTISLALAVLLVLQAVQSFAQIAPSDPPLQTGTATLPAVAYAGGWTTVSFAAPFATVPVVLTLIDETNTQPASVRIRNVSTTGFEIAQVEPENQDGNTPATNVPWVAAEQGNWTLPDGSALEVGTMNVSNTVGWGTDTWLGHTFTAGTFSAAPTVVAKLQTNLNDQESPGKTCPWGQTGMQNVSSTGFDTAIDIAEVDSACAVTTQQMGYFAVETGAAGIVRTLDGQQLAYESLTTTNTIDRHDDGCFDVGGFQNQYASAPRVFAESQTWNGSNGGWMRQCALSTTSAGLLYDEDQFNDTERTGIPETAGVFVLGPPAHTVTKTATALFDHTGASVPLGTTLLPGAVVQFTIDYDVASTGTLVLRDYFNNTDFTFLDTPTYDSTDPDAQFTFDIGADSNLDTILEYFISGTNSITVYVTVN